MVEIIKSDITIVEVEDLIPNMTSKLKDKLFAVWNAELSSKPLAFHAKNPITKPEIIIPMFPIPLYP